ncbi:uncharacterized protein VICG_01931 [Vittaforma corneae ATCC 50505]|uniref:Uncharacterized protein n=1 Tax=Vittaforma corneae (strain ATCC 50505) TaxID=993615 RepID=L2GK97_VITCO|nr:uncharacterized protein VICG_01931 [Vittaforma corneae ATCC 50505]ELA41049.1 hypothetical protein VICG_01931 [Vittaforma corneae ATCC 50505]
MNSLEKIFNSIKSSNTREMKLFSTKELIKQLKEYDDYILYILKNIYALISSENSHNRMCGAKILNSLSNFEYSFDFTLESSSQTTDYVYLQSKSMGNTQFSDISKQKREIQKALDLEYVDAELIEYSDIADNGTVRIELKTAEYREKPIENVYDFFEAINLILLSPDWYKRHGGFISYCAILASAHNWNFDLDVGITAQKGGGERGNESVRKDDRVGKIKITLCGDLFNKIFEIFKNDKFNDFQGDVTSSPVKEAASILLKYIYPMMNNKLILYEITHLLTSSDWQEQFSALLALSQLKEHFTQDLIDGNGLLENFMDLLIGLLESEDEDVKYLSADLLGYIVEKFRVSDVSIGLIKNKCWTEVENDAAIAHSKASILVLLKIIYSKTPLTPPSSFSCLYPCFTSPTVLIRNSALELSKVFEGEEFLYLLAESILLEMRGDYKHADILLFKLDRAKDASANTLRVFASHFFKIISQSLHKPYSEDDFACYDDTFFTLDGIKSIGPVVVMNNRAVLLNILLGVGDVEFEANSTLLGDTFRHLYNINHNIDTTPCVGDSNFTTVLLGSLEDAFKKYSALKKMPIKEFKTIIENPIHYSLYSLCIDICTELVRMRACECIFSVNDFREYFMLENSIEFLKIFCTNLIKSSGIEAISKNAIDLLIWTKTKFKVISKAAEEGKTKSSSKRAKTVTSTEEVKSYCEIVHEQTVLNLKVFFEVLGLRLLEFKNFEDLLSRPDRLVFFEECAEFYFSNAGAVGNTVFEEAMAKKNAIILKKAISNIFYNCLFVRRILQDFDISLLSEVIECSDPCFNVLFVKPILKNMHSQHHKHTVPDDKNDIKNDTSSTTSLKREDSGVNLLSRILSSLHFTINDQINDQYLIDLIQKEKEEVRMIVDPSLIEEYQITIPLSIELRNYQKEGVKWISFLSRFHLNGILADDMGLGKTVQTLCYILNEMYSSSNGTANDSKHTNAAPNKKVLILCPASVSSHWHDEIEKFFNIESFVYSPKRNVQNKLSDITIVSYDTFRRDTFLDTLSWYFIVFDEGHLLKNRATALYTKCKGLQADHKIILTGTPVHNSVDDLFSLFDIILPGYLGDENTFNSMYGCKVNERNVQVMENRLEALHKKTLPFVMRRLKSEVLVDLPPKIIKDLSIKMSPAQEELYRKINQSEDECDYSKGYSSLKSNSLVRLKDSLKAASHPFYFDKNVPSSKTATLLELLNMCTNSKILVFFQFKSTIDFVIEETQLANCLRLDGSVPVGQRGEVVNKFNTEAVPYLFLTTSIGGLGLNLTAADVVIFYEHDWNPFNDLQAMDRAHRLGQKRTVNVFRLICKNTVEEKVMNYQNFKLYVANSIITQQNNEIQKMDTKDILERFQQ